MKFRKNLSGKTIAKLSAVFVFMLVFAVNVKISNMSQFEKDSGTISILGVDITLFEPINAQPTYEYDNTVELGCIPECLEKTGRDYRSFCTQKGTECNYMPCYCFKF